MNGNRRPILDIQVHRKEIQEKIQQKKLSNGSIDDANNVLWGYYE